MKKSLIQKIFLVFGFLISLSLFWPNFALSQTCPTQTTVTGTSVTFVGELIDMGGDAINYVWFEYGKTSGLGQKTSEKSLTQTGIYCINVSGLEPSTTYYYRAGARNSAGTSYGEIKTFTTTAEPSVDIKANGSDGPITIAYNTSATLTWISSNVESCIASNAWSGQKPFSGSESTGNLTSLKTYTLTCSGPRGSASDSVTIKVEPKIPAEISLRKTVRNLSRGTAFSDLIEANPGDRLVVGIVVKAKDKPLYDIVVKDTLPSGLIYRGDLKVNEVLTPGNILTGLNIGNLAVDEKKTITFRAEVAGPANFPFGQTELTNEVLVSSRETSRSDTAKIIVSKTAVVEAVTKIPTGLTNTFFDFSLLPLFITLIIIWLFKSHLLMLEEWLDKKKKQFQQYKSQKLLQLKIAEIKTKEFLKKK